MVHCIFVTLLALFDSVLSADLFFKTDFTCSSGTSTPASSTLSTSAAGVLVEERAASLLVCVAKCLRRSNCSAITFDMDRCALYSATTDPGEPSCAERLYYRRSDDSTLDVASVGGGSGERNLTTNNGGDPPGRNATWTTRGPHRYLQVPGKDAVDWETAQKLCQEQAAGSDLAAVPETGVEDMLRFLKQITSSANRTWWLGPRKVAGGSWLNPDGSPSQRGRGLSFVGTVEEGRFPRYLVLCSEGTKLCRIQHGNSLNSAICQAPLTDG